MVELHVNEHTGSVSWSFDKRSQEERLRERIEKKPGASNWWDLISPLIRDSTRRVIPLPDWAPVPYIDLRGDRYSMTLSRANGDVYDCPPAYEYRGDVVAPYRFEGVVRRPGRVENLTSYEFTPAAVTNRPGVVRHCRQHPLDRGYSARVLDRLDEWFNPTPEFAPSVAPDRVEIDDDGQAGLDDFGDDFEPCPHDEIEDCHCCLCPHCLSVAVRERLSKQPRFACGNPSCGEEGIEEVVVRPARREPAGD